MFQKGLDRTPTTTDNITMNKPRKNIMGKNNPCWRGGMTDYVCKGCGTTFKAYPLSGYRPRLYCSKKCKGQHLDQTGKKNPFWKGGVSKTPHTCIFCGKEFIAGKWASRKFCNRECHYQYHQRTTEQTCLQCGKTFQVYVYDIERGKGFLCSKACTAKWMSEHYHGDSHWMTGTKQTEEHKIKRGVYLQGPECHSFKNGFKNQGGYKFILMPHKANGSGRYVQEHRLIAERVLGRKLRKGECVHHINGDKADNRHCNLLICSLGYHQWLHRNMSYLYQQEHFGALSGA